MAPKPPPKPVQKTAVAAKPAAGKKGGGSNKNNSLIALLIIGLILGLMAIAILPTTMVITVCLIPSFVSFFVDTSKEKLLGPTVLCLNLGGVMPPVLTLWRHGHSMDTAFGILTQPTMLLIPLVSAGVGWLLFAYTPQIVSGVMRRKAESRIHTLEKYQAELVQRWGNGVTTTSMALDDVLPAAPAKKPAIGGSSTQKLK